MRTALYFTRCTAATISPLAKPLGQAEHIPLPTQSRAELQTRRRRMGQDVRSPRGPRCIALVGPFQSGKTTLLEAILARNRRDPARRQRRCRNLPRRCQSRGPPSQDERRPHGGDHDLHGRQLHLHRLSGFGGVRARHARGAARRRCRDRGLRGGREEAAAAPDHPARAGRTEDSAFPVPQQDRPRQQAHPRNARRPCSRPRASRWCCARFRSGTAN